MTFWPKGSIYLPVVCLLLGIENDILTKRQYGSTSTVSVAGKNSPSVVPRSTQLFHGGQWLCVSWFVGCLTSQQHASASQGRICSDKFMCCHTETEVADPTFCLTQSQYTDNGLTSTSTDPIMPGAWQGSHWSANFEVTGMTRPGKIPSQAGFKPRIFRSRGEHINH